MFREILVPTDGSEGARRGIDHALDIAERYGARVHVLHVVDERVYATPALSGGELFLESLEEEGSAACDEVVALATDRGLDVVTECVRGMPHDAIVAYAADNDIDLVVMGKHGASNHRRHHVGTCTDHVLRTAGAPVLPV